MEERLGMPNSGLSNTDLEILYWEKVPNYNPEATGWYDVSTWLPLGSVGSLLINRVGEEVWAILKLTAIPAVQASSTNIVPVGLRPAFNEFSELLIAYGNLVPITSFGVNTTGTITLYDPVNPTNGNLSAHFKWFTKDLVPSDMPGVRV